MVHPMPPTSEAKPKQFAFVLSDAEMQMLSDLSAHDQMTKASLIRLWIRKEYLFAFPHRRPGAVTDVTLRGLLGDLASPDHYTLRNIAERMGVPKAGPKLDELLKRVATKVRIGRRAVVERVDAHGSHVTWELCAEKTKVMEAVSEAGIDLDNPLFPINPDADND